MAAASSPTVVNNSTQGHADLDVQVASLTTKVAGLDEGQKYIIGSLAALSAKMDARGTTNWGVIGTFCGVFVASGAVLVTVITVVGGLVFNQVTRDQERLSSNLSKLDEKFMPASQIDHELSIRGERNKLAQEDLRLQAIDSKRLIEKLQDNVVPRGEHEQHWANEKQANADEQRQIDDLRVRMNDLYSAKDFMRDLNDRTKMLESIVRSK